MGLQGASSDIADPQGNSPHPHSMINDWNQIRAYIRTIRSPRHPTNLNAADVAAGKQLFSSTGNCVACHSGPKWTYSKVFYTPGDVPNDAYGSMAAMSLSNVGWLAGYNTFPPALFPLNPHAINPALQGLMRFGAPTAFEQLQCVLRPVGTIGTDPGNGTPPPGVSDPSVNTIEVRQDMVTAAQGAGDTGRGFNPPSLLGLSVGAPYFHAGNSRLLEGIFDAAFTAHHQSAVAAVFAPDANQQRQLIAYLLSIDEDEPVFAIPPIGRTGGDLCHYP
jgi:hypothetical protein